MNKIAWILIGIFLVLVGIYTIIPQGLNWWKELVNVFKGVIGILLIGIGIFCFFIAKME